MRVLHIRPENLGGLFDKTVGLGKEIVGEVFDRGDLRDAGRAQQGKGTEKLHALREQAKADAHDTKAKSFGARERAAEH